MMVRQEVNLYIDSLRNIKPWLSFNISLRVISITILFLVFYSVYLKYSVAHELYENEKIIKQGEAYFSQNRESISFIERMAIKKKNVESRIDEIQDLLNKKKNIKTVYDQQFSKNDVSLHKLFNVLSIYAVKNIAIEKISILNEGGEVLIEGKSNQKGVIPDYIKNISKDQSFKDSRFGLLNIMRINEGLYQFSMSGVDGDA